jgi:hypothetical protein
MGQASVTIFQKNTARPLRASLRKAGCVGNRARSKRGQPIENKRSREKRRFLCRNDINGLQHTCEARYFVMRNDLFRFPAIFRFGAAQNELAAQPLAADSRDSARRHSEKTSPGLPVFCLLQKN